MSNPKSKRPNFRRKRNKRSKKVTKSDRLTKLTTFRQNAPVNTAFTSLMPRASISGTRSGKVVIAHREYITDITVRNDDDFDLFLDLPINPGLPICFPWLSNIAGNYESYRFRKLSFIYESVVPTTTPGVLLMGIDYDASDTPPQTKTEIMNIAGAVRSSLWSHCSYSAHQVDMHKLGAQKFIRQGHVPLTDIKTYDLGDFYVATCNANVGQAGELYVDYIVELDTPNLNYNSLFAARSLRANFTGTKTNLFQTAGALVGGLSVDFNLNSITFESTNQFLLAMSVIGTGIANPTVSITAGSIAIVTSVLSPLGTEASFVFLINVTQVNAIMSFNFATSTTISVSVLRFAPYAFLNG